MWAKTYLFDFNQIELSYFVEGVEREVLHDKDDVLVHCDAAHPPPLHIHRHLSVSDKKICIRQKIGTWQKKSVSAKKKSVSAKTNQYRQKKSVTAKKKSVSAKKKSVSDKKSKCQSISLYPPQVGLCLSPNLGANCKPAKELSPSPLRLFLTLLD